MVVGSATVKPGEIGIVSASVIMHKGMGGPHLFHAFVKSSDPEKPVITLKIKADIVSLETWRGSHPDAFYLPRDVAEFKLRSESVGIQVIPRSLKAFGYPEQLKYGYLGQYSKSKKQTRLLVAEYTDAEGARQNFSKMLESFKKTSRISDTLIKKRSSGKFCLFF